MTAMAEETPATSKERRKGVPPRIEVRAIVDLTLGAWRPREAARQLAVALGIELGPGLPADAATSPITLERRGLDIAATGDPVAFLCFDDARRIAAAEEFGKPGDRIIVTAGVPLRTPGSTNMLRIAYIGSEGKSSG